MVAIRFRKDRQVWVADWREKGKRHRRHFKSIESAEEFFQLKKNKLTRQHKVSSSVSALFFEGFTEIFVKYFLASKSKNYRKNYIQKINTMYIPFFKGKFIHKIEKADINSFLEMRMAKGLSDKTILNDLSLLRGLFKRAIEHGFAISNPCDGIKPPKNTVKRQPKPIQPVIKKPVPQETGKDLSGKNIAYILDLQSLTDVEKQTLSLCRGLTDEFNIHVIILEPGHVSHEKYIRSLVKAGARVHRIFVEDGLIHKTVKKIKDIFSKEKIDILHTHLHTTDQLGIIFKKLDRNLNWFTTVHHYYPLALMQKSKLSAYQKILNRSQWTVFTSKYVQKNTSELLTTKKSSVIYHGVKNKQDKAHAKKGSANTEAILYVGPITAHHGCEDLIKAFALIKPLRKNLSLKLIGEGPDRERLQNFVEEIELTDRIKFLSRTHNDARHYAQASIFAIPNHTEGMSLPLIQAMRHARPIVAVGGSNVTECIKDSDSALFVKPRSVYQMSMAMKQVLFDKTLAHKLGSNARKVYEERFTLDKMVEKYRVLYRMV